MDSDVASSLRHEHQSDSAAERVLHSIVNARTVCRLHQSGAPVGSWCSGYNVPQNKKNKKTDRTSRQTQAGIGHSAAAHRGGHMQTSRLALLAGFNSVFEFVMRSARVRLAVA